MKTANIYDPGATENDYLFMFNGEPVSGTGPVPTGTIQITSNGQHDVSDYATADVNVPQGITPSGSKSITENGTYDVTQYASAVVNVPQGITPSGSKSITENGTYDVTQYASAVVNVPQGGGSTIIASGTFTGSGTNPSSAGAGFSVGTKMAKTDFMIRITAQPESEFPYDTNYKYVWGIAVIDSDLAAFDLSSAGTSKNPTSAKSIKVNNSGTVTNVNIGSFVCDMGFIRNESASYGRPNNVQIDQYSDRFEIRMYNSNPSYQYPNGIKYDWEIVYFGSDPTNDIVDLGG